MAFHVLLRCLDCKFLVFGLFKRKQFLKLPLPYSIRAIDKSVLFLSCRIQFHKILCNLSDRATDTILCPAPFLSTQLVQLRFPRILARIFLNQFQLRCKNIKIRTSGILDFNIIFYFMIYLNLFNSFIHAQSMILMYYIIAYA